MLRGFLCLLVFVFTGQPSAARDLIPVEHFARIPEVSQFRISPEGDYAAMLLGLKDRRILMVADLKPGSKEKPGMAYYEDGEITWVKWVNNERLVFGMKFAYQRYGTPTSETRLFTMNRDGSKMRQLLKQKPGIKDYQHQAQFRDDVISVMPRDGKHILVAIDESNPPYPDVKMVNVYKGSEKRVLRAKTHIHNWMADDDGIVRIGTGLDDKKRQEKVIFRLSEKDDWRTIYTGRVNQAADFVPLGFTDRPSVIYVASNHEQDTLALYEYDAVKGEFLEKIFSNDTYDISGLAFGPNPLESKVVGVRYRGTTARTVYFDEDAKNRRAFLDSLFPGSLLTVVGESWNGLRLVVRVSNDTLPPSYYIIDRRDNKPQLIAQTYPELIPDDLVPMEPIEYEARDGTTIRGYLTLPKAAEHKNLPLVVMPHGGPYWRVTRGFDYWTQLVASRGYAVFEPNFRGSSGYGRSFEQSGRNEWGGKMQDDITDGVELLVKKGIADSGRICIVGASYGGYAALMGAVKTPELFRCAASFAGVTDLIDLINDTRFYTNARTARESLNERDKTRSPIHNVEEINIPILLAHGEDDRRVPFSHSKRMAAKLKSAGKAYWFLKLPEGDHHLSRGDNRLLFLEALDAFLAEHLGPGVEPPPAPVAEAIAASGQGQ